MSLHIDEFKRRFDRTKRPYFPQPLTPERVEAIISIHREGPEFY
jgi:hypothetical protein